MLVDTYCSSQEDKIIYWLKNQHQTYEYTVITLNTFIHSYNCWTPHRLQIWTAVEHSMKIINLISKHSKHNQVCLSFFVSMKMYTGPIVTLIWSLKMDTRRHFCFIIWSKARSMYTHRTKYTVHSSVMNGMQHKITK